VLSQLEGFAFILWLIEAKSFIMQHSVGRSGGGGGEFSIDYPGGGPDILDVSLMPCGGLVEQLVVRLCLAVEPIKSSLTRYEHQG